MNSKPWPHPVKFEPGVGQFRIIMTTEDAVRFLLNQWPIDEGEKLFDARQDCLDALKDEGPGFHQSLPRGRHAHHTDRISAPH